MARLTSSRSGPHSRTIAAFVQDSARLVGDREASCAAHVQPGHLDSGHTLATPLSIRLRRSGSGSTKVTCQPASMKAAVEGKSRSIPRREW